MGDPRGFLKVKRMKALYRPLCERVEDYKEVSVLPNQEVSEKQASRCMDCGTPFCHWACPVGNYIPEWNDYVFNGDWKKAYELLEACNNLPEITGRVCPAMCEHACVLGINDEPVTICKNELAIIEHAFNKGFVRPRPPKRRTGKKVAVIGSGPAGLAAASQLNKAGHKVTVIEKDNKPGGILRYGIPDFKLEKWILDRRIKLMEEEGIEFATNVNVGVDHPASELKKEFDAILLACGSRVPRDLKIDGRDLEGVHFAMDYLVQSNLRAGGERIPKNKLIDAKDKDVVVIGGGDTGADCVGTAHRQGADCIVQIELLPKPPECRTEKMPWPTYPTLLKSSTSHEEGGERRWSVVTKKFIGEKGSVKKLSCEKADTSEKFEIDADIVIIAVGFVHTEHSRLLRDLGVRFDTKGNVKTDKNQNALNHRSRNAIVKKVFVAGDMRRGQSLIVWAIAEGRQAADRIDKFLMRT